METSQQQAYEMLVTARADAAISYKKNIDEALEMGVPEKFVEKLMDERDRVMAGLTKLVEAHPLHLK